MVKDGINGFCMALADSVPGVSGGTIAFIMGFYDKFIGGIHDLAFGNMKEKKSAAAYLAKLGVGWVIGMAVVVGITVANGKTGGAAMDLTQFSVPLAVKLFFIGMIAISAMFLPGISGSTLLLIFGAYIPVIMAVKGVLSLDFSYIPCLTFFGCGILAGAVTVVKAIKACLEKFRAQTIYLILGMMIGSLYAIGMGPTTLEIPQAPLGAGNFPLVPAVIGVGLVFGMQKIKEKGAEGQKE